MTNQKNLELAKKKIHDVRSNEALFVNLKVTFNWRPNEGDSTDFESFPPKESIKAAAMDLRHFLAPGSLINMGTLVKYLREQPDTDIEKLDKFYRIWREYAGLRSSKTAAMGHALNMDGEDLTLKMQIDLWMNGELFHLDDQKIDKLERMTFSSFRDQSWMIFVNALQHLSGLLIYFDRNFLIKNK
ncbi:hypothetical protein KC967_00435 [Candidatus Saccharibacteria bacterium]|nr:hypothetical protein [Candidatus Saccharibacteria bacterium]